MLSSISNFNPDFKETSAPKLAYGKLAAVAFLTAALLLIGAEHKLRQKGYTQALEDTQLFWAVKRSQVYSKNGRKKLVIVGASRSQLGLVPDVLRQEFPDMDIVHLALDGKLPYSTLKDLAEDPKFDGWILCDCPIWGIIDESQKPDVEYYHRYFDSFWGQLGIMDRKTNALIKAWLQERFVVISAYLKYAFVLRQAPLYMAMDGDRYRPSYYRTKTKPGELPLIRERRIKATNANYVVWEKMGKISEDFATTEMKRINGLIEKKGGKLILLRLPTTGERWPLDEKIYPKKYWDRLHEWSGALTIHFKDYPELSGFECPDTSHLDALDAPIFTRNLARIVKAEAAGEAYHSSNTIGRFRG